MRLAHAVTALHMQGWCLPPGYEGAAVGPQPLCFMLEETQTWTANWCGSGGLGKPHGFSPRPAVKDAQSTRAIAGPL